MSEERLTALRARIAELDRTITAQVAERLAAAREIGEIKSARNLPVRDYGVEARVLERFLDAASSEGIDPEIGRGLAGLLIDHAVRLQSGIQDHSGSLGAGEVLVIGGLGKMGRWMSGYFHSRGHHVRVMDPADGECRFDRVDDLSAAADAAIIVLAVPIPALPELLEGVAATGTKALVLDLSSLKSRLSPSLRQACARGLRLASLHPMFGPDAPHLIGRNILFCDCGDKSAVTAARKLFEGTGANLLDLQLQEHDRRMGYVLGLSHLVNIIFAGALAESGLSYGELGRVASTTFDKQLTTTLDVARENPDLYFEIQSENPETVRIGSDLRDALDEVLEVVAAGDRGAFRSIMEKGRGYFFGD